MRQRTGIKYDPFLCYCLLRACLLVKVKVKGPMWSGRHEDEGINTKNIVNRDRLSSKNTELTASVLLLK